MGFEEGPHLERVERRDNRHWPMVVIGLGFVLVTFAVFHPWSPNSGDVSGKPDRAAASALPSQERAPYDPTALYPQCFSSPGWRIASLQQQPRFKVRTAWPVTTQPLPTAAGANTPTLFGSGVEAIGFCTPGFDSLTRSQYVGDVSLWRRTPAGTVVPVVDPGVLDPALAADGEVYLTPPGSISVDGTWPPGDYFFQVRPRGSTPDTNSAASRWLAMRLVPDSQPAVPRQPGEPRQTRFMQPE